MEAGGLLCSYFCLEWKLEAYFVSRKGKKDGQKLTIDEGGINKNIYTKMHNNLETTLLYLKFLILVRDGWCYYGRAAMLIGKSAN